MSGTTRHQGIIPPHMLNHLVVNGSVAQRAKAEVTLHHGKNFHDHPRPPKTPFEHANLSKGDAQRGHQRSVCDANNGKQLPGKRVRAEGQPPTEDPAVDEAYYALGATYDFYWHVYGRDSIDNRGHALLGTVHYGTDYQNAFWNGEQMIFGDGDGELFQRFTRSLEVVAHELTHGVTQSEGALAYADQSGALNESISDVFGVLTKQYACRQTAEQADWLVGADLLTDQVKGVALRSMKDPGTAYDDPVLGKDPQPADMAHYIHTPDDDGGVHINSGIPNRAFYLAAVSIGGFAWERAGQVWYDTLCDTRLSKNAEFGDFAALTLANAKSRFSTEPKVARAIARAWQMVGVKPSKVSMNKLPELDDSTVIRISRQGGVVAVPGLIRPRNIALCEYDRQQRTQICALLLGCMLLAARVNGAGHGDERFYQIELKYHIDDQEETEVIKIIESNAPSELVKLWDTGEMRLYPPIGGPASRS